MDEKYTEIVKDHFFNPRNVGEISDADGVGTVGNPTCGDVMTIYIKVKNDIITDIKFKTYGCAAAIATSSITTEIVKGMNAKVEVLEYLETAYTGLEYGMEKEYHHNKRK